jgi:hypothetical protein
MKLTENELNINVGDLMRFRFRSDQLMRYVIISTPAWPTLPTARTDRSNSSWLMLVLTVHPPSRFPAGWTPGSVISVTSTWIKVYLEKIS